jgi:trans-feruloyl-CoA hydratase/vanillin synthase
MPKKKDYTCVLVDTDDEGITWITFNRPEKRNAMSPTLHLEMEEILYGLETDSDTKVIVLTGAGNSWSAGMDLKQYFRETDNDPTARFRAATAHRRWATELLTWSRKPTIAMVNGYCYGGAFVSLAACDIVIAADNATFGLSEVNWGIIPGGNVSKVFGDMVSFRNALFYAMTGRTIDGRKAVELGIATLSVPADQLRQETVTVARELMAKSPRFWPTPNKQSAPCAAWIWIKLTNIWAQRVWRCALPIRNRRGRAVCASSLTKRNSGQDWSR